MRPTCTCDGTIAMLRRGAVVCSGCGAAVVSGEPVERADEVSTIMLPLDAKNADAFNRACREKRVPGARKVGRVWICSRQAWEQRTRSAPAVSPEAKARAKRVARPKVPTNASAPVADELPPELLAEMGARKAS